MKFTLRRPFIAYSDALPDPGKYYVRNNTLKPFHFPTDRFEKLIKESFDKYQATPQVEYFFRFTGNSIIEPVQGWAITDKNQLIYESIPFSKDRRINFPSFWRTTYLKMRGKRIYLPSAVSIRYSWQNYFHFLNDGMGQLYLLDDVGVSTDIPVVIPSFVRDTGFGKYLLQNHPAFTKRTIVFQEPNQLIFTENLYCVKNIPNLASRFVKIAGDLQLPAARNEFPKKIFLTRKGTYSRRINNADEVHNRLQQQGFTIVDTAELEVPDQINLFRTVTHVVGVHGAGLTNLAFAGKDVRVLEVFPSNSIPPHFFWLASGLGMDYHATTHGDELNGGFNIDPEKLIDEMRNLNFI